MRLKDYDDRDGKRVWLSESELSGLIAQDDTPEQRVAFLLAGRCGLRRQEIVDVRKRDLVETDTGHVVRVWDGKGDKYREPPAPTQLVDYVDAFAYDMADDARLVGTEHGSTVFRWVERAADAMHEQTGDEGWRYVGPHDLRRSWGVRVLEAGVLPSVVMEWGGWRDWQTFRDHYLAEFSPEALRRERDKVGFLGGVGADGDDTAAGVVVSGGQPTGSDVENHPPE